MTNAFVSWSGGKDGCLAYYRALKEGIKGQVLLNMAREDGSRSRSHGLSTELLNMQAKAMGMSLVQGQATWDDYEAEFKRVLLTMKEKGITHGVFGDIDYVENRGWVERVCHECGITPHLPIWGEDQEKLLNEFIDAGFTAAIVCTKADIMNEEWLGREVDNNLKADMEADGNITPCGEAGEFHTFVTGGPLFSGNITITEAEKVLIEDHWFYNIRKAVLN